MTTHQMPPGGTGLAPCCLRPLLELPATDRVTKRPDRVNCRGPVVLDLTGSEGVEINMPDPPQWTMTMQGGMASTLWDKLTLPQVKLTMRDGHTIEGLLKTSPDGHSHEIVQWRWTCGCEEHN